MTGERDWNWDKLTMPSECSVCCCRYYYYYQCGRGDWRGRGDKATPLKMTRSIKGANCLESKPKDWITTRKAQQEAKQGSRRRRRRKSGSTGSIKLLSSIIATVAAETKAKAKAKAQLKGQQRSSLSTALLLQLLLTTSTVLFVAGSKANFVQDSEEPSPQDSIKLQDEISASTSGKFGFNFVNVASEARVAAAAKESLRHVRSIGHLALQAGETGNEGDDDNLAGHHVVDIDSSNHLASMSLALQLQPQQQQQRNHPGKFSGNANSLTFNLRLRIEEEKKEEDQ